MRSVAFVAAVGVICALAAARPAACQGPSRRSEDRRTPEDQHPPEDRRPPREFRGPGPGPPRGGFDGPAEAYVGKKGFVFIEGEYLAPPYKIELARGKLLVNGRELNCLPPSRSFGGRGFGPGRGGDQSWRFAVGEMANQLGNQCVVMSFKEQPYLVLDSGTANELLLALTAVERRSLRQIEVMDRLPEDFDKKVFDEWIRDYTPPDDLLQRAAYVVRAHDETQREAQAEIRATQWMSRLSYPLTMASMVLTVLSIGHLLGGRPHANKPTLGIDVSPEMILALNWSLFFAAAFSSIDLVWTILAANANQMRELNPIGSHLIENPRHLAGFKVGVTFSCLAVLWLLRKHKRAQIAAWWVCLILTLVTIRWLTFNSLMVSG